MFLIYFIPNDATNNTSTNHGAQFNNFTAPAALFRGSACSVLMYLSKSANILIVGRKVGTSLSYEG